MRFEDDVTVTGVSRKKLKITEDKNTEKTQKFDFEDYHKSYCESQKLRSCYTPERIKRVCPEFEPELDFSIGWAKKFLKKISM